MTDITARGRYKLLLANGGISGVSQAANFIVSLVLIALVQRHFGTVALGIWLAVGTLIMLLSVSDFGVGNAVISIVSKIPRGLSARRFEVVFVATIATVLLGSTLLIVGLGLSYFSLWEFILNFDGSAAFNDLGAIFFYVAIYFSISLPLSVVEKLQIAEQRAYIPRGLEALSSIVALITCPLAIDLGANLGQLFLARYLPFTIFRLFNTVWYWRRNARRFSVMESARLVHFRRKVVIVGSSFFVMSLAGAVALNSDTLLISYILGVDRVPEYAVPYRLFIAPSMFIGFFALSLWSAYAAAWRIGDGIWVKKTYFRTLIFAAIFSILYCAVLFVVASSVIEAWLGEPIQLPAGMLIAQSIWCFLSSTGGVSAPVLNAMSMERLQAKLSVYMVIINIPLSIALIHIMGPQGAMWGSVISVFALVTCPIHFQVFRIFGIRIWR